MKKFYGLVGSLFVISLCVPSVHALTCAFVPASGTCSTQRADVMLKNTTYLEYWKNAKCLDLIIKYAEKKGTKTSDDDKESISKGLRTGSDYWYKHPADSGYWEYMDRVNYINYKLGNIHAGCSTSTTNRGNVCEDTPACSIRVNHKEIALGSGEEIVNFVATDFPPSDPSRQQLLEVLAGKKICLMKLNTLRTAEWANSPDYVTLLRDVTNPAVTSVADAYLDADKRHYDKCVMQDERAKMKAFLEGKIPSGQGTTPPQDLNVGPGGSSQGNGGSGKGGGGKGGGGHASKGGYKISPFKINESELRSM